MVENRTARIKAPHLDSDCVEVCHRLHRREPVANSNQCSNGSAVLNDAAKRGAKTLSATARHKCREYEDVAVVPRLKLPG